MTLSAEERKVLSAQWAALESILMELIPLGVPLNEPDIRTWGEQKSLVVSPQREALPGKDPDRFLNAVFQDQASQVVRLVDGVDSSNPAGLFALVTKAAQVGTEQATVRDEVATCCVEFLSQGFADEQRLSKVLVDPNISPVEARCLGASMAFWNSTVDESLYIKQFAMVFDTLKSRLERNDPFLRELDEVCEALNC